MSDVIRNPIRDIIKNLILVSALRLWSVRNVKTSSDATTLGTVDASYFNQKMFSSVPTSKDNCL